MSARIALYSAVDQALTHFEVDVEQATLTRKATIELPAKLQYAWPHPSRRHLYVTTTNGGPRMPSDVNHVSALAIAPDGSLRLDGPPRPLARRAVHLCVDPTGRYVVNAHNFQGGGLTVHRIEQDGRLGSEVAQDPGLNLGIYPHQVMVSPSGQRVWIIDRGNKPTAEKPEDPGALRSYVFQNGQLSPGQVVAPAGGFGFGPRHLVFHPTQPWMYVADERFNRLTMFRMHGDELEPEPAFTRELLADPAHPQPRQIAGGIQMHPSGRFVYVANRADQTVEVNGAKVFGGGENNIAVYAIHPDTGEPTLVQHADTRSIHVRTFACDPTGRLLVTASIKAHAVLEDGHARPVPAALSVFRIGDQGRLDFVRTIDIDTEGGRMQYWMGMLAVPGAA